MVCDGWAGCAMVSGNTQDGWYIEQSDQAARGEAVLVGNVCTIGARCDAVRLQPPGVTCPPWTLPPKIATAPYRCLVDGYKCHQAPAH
jgi:hypothetical protein